MILPRPPQDRHRDLIPKFREKITLGQLILACAFIILAFSSCQIAIANRQLAERKITNVQLVDGNALVIEQKEGNYRNPQLIKTFVQQWISLMFSWEGKQSGTDKPDPGVKTTSGDRVPINSWAASMMMEPEFSEEFLNGLAELIPSEVFSGRLRSAAYVRYISEPRQISSAAWEVDVIATRTIFDETARTQRQIIPFNKTFLIRAVAIPTSPLGENANSYEKTIYKMRSSGLEITAITNYDDTP